MMMFVLGVLVWQVVTTVVYFVTGEDDKKALLCGCGVCSVVLTGVGAIIYKIRLHNSRKYNLYQFFASCDYGTFGGWVGNYYMTEKVAERFNLIDRNADPAPYSVRLYRAGYEFKSVPAKNEILTVEMIESGIDGMSNDCFKKFFKRA